MNKIISAAEANRKFSQVLREVQEGASYTVTSHGRPVARIAPLAGKRSERTRARTSLFRRLRREKVVNVGPWKREELYD